MSILPKRLIFCILSCPFAAGKPLPVFSVLNLLVRCFIHEKAARFFTARLREKLIGSSEPTLGLHGGFLAHIHAASLAIKEYASIHQRENRVVTSHAHALAGMKLGAALAHNDVARYNGLTAEFFHAEPLAARITPITYGALSFFMCHVLNSVKC